jgi:transcriptional regulator with XRE-family HTH domain
MDLAKRLVELRIYNDMSQDELSDKADISKKDIERWESGKDSPDGAQLIKLSQAYNMPIDEILLNFDTDSEYASAPGPESAPVFENKNKNDGAVMTRKKTSYNWYAFPYPVIVLAAYLCFGLFFGAWHPTWLIFLTIPIFYMLVTVNRAKSFSAKAYVFPYPIIAVILYLALGFDYGIWHPSWLLFLTIPIYYMVVTWLVGSGK